MQSQLMNEPIIISNKLQSIPRKKESKSLTFALFFHLLKRNSKKISTILAHCEAYYSRALYLGKKQRNFSAY